MEIDSDPFRKHIILWNSLIFKSEIYLNNITINSVLPQRKTTAPSLQEPID
jgi:hypothetical protein